MMQEVLGVANFALTLLGLGGLVYWLREQIGALKGAVEAQEKTIAAQSAVLVGHEGLLKTMETVIRSTDEPRMLERLEAHKKFVEHEKEAALAAKDAELREHISSLMDLVGRAIVFVGEEDRIQIIERSGLTGEIKASVLRIAAQAPELSREVPAIRSKAYEMAKNVITGAETRTSTFAILDPIARAILESSSRGAASNPKSDHTRGGAGGGPPFDGPAGTRGPGR